MRQEQTRRPARTTGRRSRHTQPRPLCAWLRWATWSRVLSFNLRPSTLNAPRSGGAVIIVVLALLTTLMVLGLFHFRWVGQELINADTYVNSAATEIDPDAVFEVALRQAIVSVPNEYPLSALNASVNGNNVTFWSLLAHQLGAVYANGTPSDLQPHNGRGISILNPVGPSLDYDGDGAPETQYVLNFSAMANGGAAFNFTANPGNLFAPDAGYTYPDINSPFLAMDYFDPATGAKVIKPSFTLPGYLLTPTAQQSFRVHTGHGVANVRGYVIGAPEAALSGDRNRIISQYVIPTASWGAYQGTTTYTLDKDLDGDGYQDSVDMDLGHGIIDLPGGRQVVPIFQFKITDLDGLINLNTAANQALVTHLSNESILAGTPQQAPANILASTSWTHQSNMGLSRSEINPLFALRANSTSANYVDTADRDWATAPLWSWVAGGTAATPPWGTMSRLQSANIELARMLYGAPDSFASDLTYSGAAESDLVGRYGRDNSALRGFLQSATGIVPTAGAVTANDDFYDYTLASVPPGTNPYASMRGIGGRAYADGRINSKLPTVPVPPFVHPLDYSGAGDLNGTAGATYRRSAGVVLPGDYQGERILAGINTNSPVRWPQYPQALGYGLYENQGVSTDTVPVNNASFGYRTMRDAATLQPGSSETFLWNHPNAMNQFTDLGSGNDAPFSFGEIAALQLSDADWNRLGESSRLRKLLPFNFENNKQAARIRSHFTTSSWDRTEIGFAPFSHLLNRQWEFENTVDLDTVNLDSLTMLPTTLSLGDHLAFPPQFGSVLASRHDLGNIIANDPFRPEIRRLLTTFSPDSAIAFALGTTPATALAELRKAFPRQKLNINRILSDDLFCNGGPAFDRYGNALYRELVPHIVEHITLTTPQASIVHAAMVHDNLTQAAYDALEASTHPISRFDDIGTANADAKAVQEWWARYDRQRLARDIYVLLYTTGGPDTTNVTATGTSHDAATCREMAQFAVNYVDALDRDDCISVFQYDTDLSDGWQAGTSYVYGVESQQLVIGEALLVKTPGSAGGDFATTLHRESNDDLRFLYMELRNVSPLSVNLCDGFRIMRIDRSTSVDDQQISAEFKAFGSQRKPIGAGENFLIACHDGAMLNGASQSMGSELVVDYKDGNELEYIVPRRGATDVETNNSVLPLNHFDLDMTADPAVVGNDRNFVDFIPVTSPPPTVPFSGTTLVERTAGGGSTDDLELAFALQRRRNPYLAWTLPAENRDEWVEVDRIILTQAQLEEMQFEPGSNGQANNLNAIKLMKSLERFHHFTDQVNQHSDDDTETDPDPDLPYHSMWQRTGSNTFKHRANEYIREHPTTSIPDVTDIRIWQPHFDRDFSSAMELLSVPLYGLRFGTNEDVYAAMQDGGPVRNLVKAADRGRLAGYNTAQLRFLFPEGEPTAGHPWNGVASIVDRPNRWYRLFNFLDIPDSADDVVETALRYQRRTPGKLNLNLIRHEAVLAGLVDDDVHHNGITNADRPTTDLLDITRVWMDEMQIARDRNIVNIAGLGNAALPGSPVSRPFRPAGWIDPANPDDSVKSSLLRFQDDSAGAFPNLGLFEARQSSDISTEGMDYHTRHRLLAKVANNSTVRSHVFAMWVGFDLHEAHVNATGQVQIGGKATDLPSYRMFCVVDMSRLEEAYDPVSGTFDFRKFIIHQQLLP